jgi:hypothetical protein
MTYSPGVTFLPALLAKIFSEIVNPICETINLYGISRWHGNHLSITIMKKKRVAARLLHQCDDYQER